MSTPKTKPPPDVVFAQKATAIVKAAGMDPRTIDLEKFRQNASIVFSRAYSAIYKEELVSVLNENSSKDDMVLNSQLVLDGLYAKTRNPVLLQLSGLDLYQGNHKAIGVLVGILFAEGQRLWLEKVRQAESPPRGMGEEPANDEGSGQEVALGDNAEVQKEINSLEDNHGMPLDNEGQAIRNSLKQLHKMRSNPDIGPADLERLLSRIAFLEEQLQRKNNRKKNAVMKRTVRKNVGRRFQEKISEAIMQDNEISAQERKHRKNWGQHRGDDSSGEESDDQKDYRTTQSSPRSAGRRPYPGKNSRSAAGGGGGRRGGGGGGGGSSPGRSRSPHRVGKRPGSASATAGRATTSTSPPGRTGAGAGVRRVRPTSAPSARRHGGGKVRHTSHRLYNAALYNRKQQQQQQQSPRSPSPAGKGKEQSESNNQFEGGNGGGGEAYTYDWRSGRRIPLSAAQLEYEERMRAKEAMGNILAISDMEVDALMGGGAGTGGAGDAAAGPTHAVYPTKSIAGDVDKWLGRMRRKRHGAQPEPPMKVEDLPLPEAKYFSAYQKLEERDLVISIEHCHNCQHHNVTTRHKPDEYLRNCSVFLKILAQIAHECGVCARVGVTRIKAHVTPKSSLSDHDSRIGAFEIQAAYRPPKGGKVIPVTLHSKLATRRWPAKSVLEKRFRAFISKAKVTISMEEADPHAKAEDVPMAEDSALPYPVGVAAWTRCPLSEETWDFGTAVAMTQAKAAEATAAAAASASDPASAAASAAAAAASSSSSSSSSSIPNVQWAFDLRTLADAPPKFEVGSMIRVRGLPFSSNNLERHALLAEVKSYEHPDEHLTSDLIVKPKYHAQTNRVSQFQCVNLDQYEDQPQYPPEQVPVELEILLLQANVLNLMHWVVSLPQDYKEAETGDVYLCRRSFYTQIRKLAWAAEKKLLTSKDSSPLLPHPDRASGDPDAPASNGANGSNGASSADVQLSYSEEVLDWVFSHFVARSPVNSRVREEEGAGGGAAAAEVEDCSVNVHALVRACLPAEPEPAEPEPEPAEAEAEPSSSAAEPKPEPEQELHTTAATAAVGISSNDPSQPPSARASGGADEEAEKETNASTGEAQPSPPAVSLPAGEMQQEVKDSESAGGAGAGAAENSMEPPTTTTAEAAVDVVEAPVDAAEAAAAAVVVVVEEEDKDDPSAAPVATVDPSTADAHTTTATPTTTAAAAVSTSEPEQKSAVPSNKKRFSSADLKGAAEQALRNKILIPLHSPKSSSAANRINADAGPEEKMKLVFELAQALERDAEFDQNDDDILLLAQTQFVEVLEDFGLVQLFNTNAKVKESLFVKGGTSQNTPDVPVVVNKFVSWLQEGEKALSWLRPQGYTPIDSSKESGVTADQTQKEETGNGGIEKKDEIPAPPAVPAVGSDLKEESLKEEEEREEQVAAAGAGAIAGAGGSVSPRVQEALPVAHAHAAMEKHPRTTSTSDHSRSQEQADAQPAVEQVPDQPPVDMSSPPDDAGEPVEKADANVVENTASAAGTGATGTGATGTAVAPGGDVDDSKSVVSGVTNPNTARSAAAGNPVGAAEASRGGSGSNTGRSSNGGASGTGSRPHTGRSSVVSVNALMTPAERAQLQQRELAKDEELRKTLQCEPQELAISSIVIESDQLAHEHFDSVFVNLCIGKHEWKATNCLHREKGSRRRTYNVSWPAVMVSADEFKNGYAYASVVIADQELAKENAALPFLPTTTPGESPHSCKIALFKFMKPSFEVKREVHVEPLVIGTKSKGWVKLSIIGHARTPQATRQTRIMSMQPADLLNVKFDNLLGDDAEDLLSEEGSVQSLSSNRSATSRSSIKAKEKERARMKKMPSSVREEEEEMKKSLFPKASMMNMSGLNVDSSIGAGIGDSVKPLANDLVEENL